MRTTSIRCPRHVWTRAEIPLIRQPSSRGTLYLNFSRALAEHANRSRVIILLVVSEEYVEMAINIYTTSLRRLRITNYLFVCIDSASAVRLTAIGINCHLQDFSTLHADTVTDRVNSDEAQPQIRYGSVFFKTRTHAKTLVVLGAIRLKYSVLIVDLDIIFFRNPLPNIKAMCGPCDIIMQTDGMFEENVDYNSGFYLVRPTAAGIRLHTNALDLARREPSLSNQKAIGRVLRQMVYRGQIIRRSRTGRTSGKTFPRKPSASSRTTICR